MLKVILSIFLQPGFLKIVRYRVGTRKQVIIQKVEGQKDYINVMNAGKHNIIECDLNIHLHKTPIVLFFLSISPNSYILKFLAWPCFVKWI